MNELRKALFLKLTLLVAGVATLVLAQDKPTIVEFDAPGAGTSAYQGTIAVDINPAGSGCRILL